MADVHKEPSKVDAEDGVVLVDGPGCIEISLTPDAAIETSERLLDAGARANGQNVEKKMDPNAPRYG